LHCIALRYIALHCVVLYCIVLYCIALYFKVKVPRNRSEGLEWARGIALPFLDLATRRGWVVSTTPRPFYPRESPGTHCTGGWVGPRANLDVCKKSRSHRDSIPGLSSP
jgi:hypothetical protein